MSLWEAFRLSNIRHGVRALTYLRDKQNADRMAITRSSPFAPILRRNVLTSPSRPSTSPKNSEYPVMFMMDEVVGNMTERS